MTMVRVIILTLLPAWLMVAPLSFIEGQLAGAESNATPMGDICTAQTVVPLLAIPNGSPIYTCVQIPITTSATITAGTLITTTLAHTWIGDLEFQLRAPGGTPFLTMLQRPGRTTSGFGDSSNLSENAPIRFGDDDSFDAETMGATISGFQSVCADDGECAFAPNRDQDGNSLATFADFAKTSAMGLWEFCVRDSAGADIGTLYTVTLDLACTPPATAVALSYLRVDPAPQPMIPLALVVVVVTLAFMAVFRWRQEVRG